MKRTLVVMGMSLLVCMVAWAAGPTRGPVLMKAAKDNLADSFHMSVAITAPDPGKTFGLNADVEVDVIPQGDASNIPYTLTVRFNGLISQSFEVLSPDYLGVPRKFVFKLATLGSGSFTAFLVGRDGSYKLADCGYDVAETAPPQMGVGIPWFTEEVKPVTSP